MQVGAVTVSVYSWVWLPSVFEVSCGSLLISSGALWDSEEETTLYSFKKAEEFPPDSPCPLQPESAVTAISNTAAAKAIFLKRIINLLNLYFGFKAHKP